MMRDKLVVLLTLLQGCFFYGQNITVKDSLTHTPLEAVVIRSSTDQKLSTTNHLGIAKLPQHMGDTIYLNLDKYKTKYVLTNRLSNTEKNVVYLHSDVFQLGSIITTGTNWKNRSQKSPAHIISLSEKEVHILNQSTTADLLNQTHEVYIQKSQLGGGSPMLRGFATNRLILSVDGVNMNNAIFRSGNIQNVIAIDPFTLKNVEVISGPASVLYGSDAIGGVISFETKEILPTKEFSLSGDVIARYATSSNEKTMHGDLNFSTPKWASYTSISYSDYGDLKMGKNGPSEYLRPHYVQRINDQDVQIENEDPYVQKFTGYQQKNLMQKLRFQPSQALDFSLTFNFAETSDVPRYDRLLRYEDDDQLKSAEWFYGPQQWLFTNFKTEYTKANFFFDEFKNIISHQYFTESRHDRDFNAINRRNRYERVNVWGWETNFLKRINKKHILQYGADIKFNHINSSANTENIITGNQAPIASRYPDGSKWNQYGVYAKINTELLRGLNLKTGLRYSYVTSASTFTSEFYPLPFENADFQTGALTGIAGIYYKPFRHTVLNVQFSTGFRAPNIDDIGKIFDSEPGNVIIPNPNLKPEYIYSIETGASRSFGNIFYINGLVYYSWLKDALVRRDFTLNGVSTLIYDGELSQIQAIQNASNARVFGGLVQMELNINKEVKLLGKINYTHGEEELDDGTIAPMRHAAPLFGNLGIKYEKNRLQTKLDYEFNGEIKAENMPPSESEKSYLYALNSQGQPYAPAWNVLNFSSQYKLTDNISLQFRVDNILDKLYRPYSSGISASGRNFVLSVRTIF